ncbi:MAG: class IV adenylate cyclase [Candidatus Eisenbacteria bacterium]|nr:class IV adenylate cyclase [Candidatus Eisenbacteria bacterium]
MSFINIEIKARCSSLDAVRRVLKERQATFKGVDRQVDTYFNVSNGRLKLREGNIERCLIHYSRKNQAGPKKSIVTLYGPVANSALKETLTNALGVLVAVEKTREIYFIDNVKFHVDAVERLGTFVEIEATDSSGIIGQEVLRRQCEEFMGLLGIRSDDLVKHSYCDMMLRQAKHSSPGRRTLAKSAARES